MERFNVIIEPKGYDDLYDILFYISDCLKEPSIAKKIYSSIKTKIQTLEHMPNRQPLIDEEPYRHMGLRKLLIGNYIAFYTVDETNQTVHIIRILYSRRNWKDLI